MYLNDTIKEKFINESANIIIESLLDYSEYINENKDFQFYYELVPYHLIGYNACEKFLTDNFYSAFEIIRDYVNDYRDILGDSPEDINSEYVFQFYLDSYLGYLANDLECAELFENGELNEKETIKFIENWRAEQIKELYKF